MASKEPKNEFYVYAYFRPWNGEPCYVGKGSGDRWAWHEKRNSKHPNKHFARIFRKAGGAIPRLILRAGLSEVEAFETEKALIAAIGRGTSGPLVNLTDGGDGSSGHIISEDAKKAISERQKKRFENPENKKYLIGKPFSDQTRKKISEAQKRAWIRNRHSNEIKTSKSKAMKEVWKDPDYRQRISEARSASYDESLRAARSEVSKALWADPSHRTKMLEVLARARKAKTIRAT